MKILATNPYAALAGDILDPSDVSKALRYAADAFEDAAELRLQEMPWTLPFMRGFGTTEAASLEERTIRFVAPYNATIERAYLSANLTSNAEVQVTIETLAAATPEGATAPYLTTVGAVASVLVDVEDVNQERVTLVAGTTYLVKIVPLGTMTVERFDITLHLRFDRWQLAAATTLVPPTITLPRSGDARDAVALNASLTSLALAGLSLADNEGPPVPCVAIAVSFTSASAAGSVTTPIPRLSNARGRGRVVRIDMFALWDAATADTVTGTLRDETGAVLETLVCAGGGGTFDDAALVPVNRSLVSGTANVTTTPAQDYSFRFASSGATNVRKAYAILWFAR